MRRIAVLAARADAFCARLNHGLTAVALALATVTLALWITQHPSLFQPLDMDWAVTDWQN
jgi:hypothetical protein